MQENEAACRALEFWQTIEFLNQPSFSFDATAHAVQAYKKGAKRNRKYLDCYIKLNEGEDLLSELRKEAVACGMPYWGDLTVYIGFAKRDACIRRIAKLMFPQDAEERLREFPDRDKSEIAWLSLQLSSQGLCRKGSFSLSPLLWAIKRLQKGSSDALNMQLYSADVEEDERKIRDDFVRVLQKDGGNGLISCEMGDENDVSGNEGSMFSDDAVTSVQLYRLAKIVCKSYSDSNFLIGENATVGIAFRLFKNEEAMEAYRDCSYSGLRNTFFVTDLEMVQRNVQSLPGGLRKYIVCLSEGYNPGDREDILRPRDLRNYYRFLLDRLNVSKAPLGKWPSRYMPSLMQQLAINEAVGMPLSDGSLPIFSVNGPPGTGKTTMLKEIVANNVVERARLLAEYDDPDNAFRECKFMGEHADDVPSYFCLRNDDINSFGILVASCNNAAAENITKELPREETIHCGMEAVDGDDASMVAQLEDTRRLFCVADSDERLPITLFNDGKPSKEEQRDIFFTHYADELLGGGSWGLIAAPLGKMKNTAKFCKNVLEPVIFQKSHRQSGEYETARKSFMQQLKKVEEARVDLAAVCDSSTDLLDAQIALEETEADFARFCQTAGDSLESIAASLEHVLGVCGIREGLPKDVGEAISFTRKLVADACRNLRDDAIRWGAQKAETANQRGIVSRLRRLISPASFDEVDEQLVRLDEAIREANAKMGAICAFDSELYDLGIKLGEKQSAVWECTRRLESCEESYGRKTKEGRDAEGVDKTTILDMGFVRSLIGDDVAVATEAHTRNPWFSQRYNREREKLFRCAVRLNKEFVLSSECCRKNLKTLFCLWQGRYPGNNQVFIRFGEQERRRAAVAAFQTLFLLVPVVSTTFASVSRFLNDVREPGALGTLIIDEAGQAQPQMALGVLFRSRRAVIVGDPRQVEPVSTDDLKLLKHSFEDSFYVPYKNKNNSVQKNADMLNSIGTFLSDLDGSLEWVGCPLPVHRRCVAPMYEISNEISYGGFMKQQTAMPKEAEEALFVYEKSQWLNVKGCERDGSKKDHFVSAQAEKAIEIIEMAFERSDDPSLYVITPFTSVKEGMRNYMKAYCKKYPESPVGMALETVDGRSAWLDDHIGTVHTFQGKEAYEVVFVLGCDSSTMSSNAIRWVSANIVNVAVTRARYRLYVIGDIDAWQENQYVSAMKTIMDTLPIREIERISKDPTFEGDREEAIVRLAKQLPSVQSFPIEVKPMEDLPGADGNRDFAIGTEAYVKGLAAKKGFPDIDKGLLRDFNLDDEKLARFGEEVRDYIEWALWHYGVLKPVYDVHPELDVSSCAILFCKAAELHVRECLRKPLEEMIAEKSAGKEKREQSSIEGQQGKKRKAKGENDYTLGKMAGYIRDHSNQLAVRSKATIEGLYTADWWFDFQSKLRDCASYRNACCHASRFDCEGMKQLLSYLFYSDGAYRKKVEECGWPDFDRKGTASLEGVMFEAEHGRDALAE